MGKRKYRHVVQSKFIRTVFFQALPIFLVVSIAIVVIVFYSFASEINKNILSDKQNQLDLIEKTITKRMEEATNIAYQISNDSSFTLTPVAGVKYSGYEISNTLGKYMAGNGFIEYLAYYRLSEPDRIYTSRGELLFVDFWSTYLGVDKSTADVYIQAIRSTTGSKVTYLSFGESRGSFFSYTYALPLFSKSPQAFVLMLMPLSEISPMTEAYLKDTSGQLTIYDADGNEVYRASTLDKPVPSELLETSASGERISFEGEEYVAQRQKSPGNGWTYIAMIRLSDMISGLASKQLTFIILLLGLMFIAIFATFVCIAVQYKPISTLAGEVSDDAGGGRKDEREVLSSMFDTYKGDKEQKQIFETAYHEAEAASKAKSEFLSSMSHDIRTPMNAIIGLTAMAYKYADDEAYVKDCLEKVQVSSRYLLDIINNVLDMSRIESGRFSLAQEDVDLPKLVYGLTAILSQSVEAKKQRFRVDTEGIIHERVIGDSVRLMQVLINILSNSVKFTKEGGSISLYICEKQSTEAGYADYVFICTDTGIGMSPEFVERVFDTFTRAQEGGSVKVEGTGLGMAIAKSLVELMGGTISCESELGKGTVFTVNMHMQLPEESAEAEPKSHAGENVLIVGGDDRLRKSQASVFAATGAATLTASTVQGAAEAAGEAAAEGRAPSLVVLNPTEDGTGAGDAVAAIRAASPGADIRFAITEIMPGAARQSVADDANIHAYVQLPLFISTARELMGEADNGKPDGLHGAGEISLAGRRALVAEDNAINRYVAQKILTNAQAEMVEAENGQAAVEVFKAHPEGYFDWILMDLRMPVMNGYEAAAAIRALPRADAKTVTILALTASSFDEDVRRVKDSGMNGHISKPYTPESLCLTLLGYCK